MMPDWIALHPDITAEHLGLIPGMLDTDDPAPARKQLDSKYQYGGGWRPMEGFQLRRDLTLKYPGDPALHPLALTRLREETIILYEHAWVLILQRDKRFEVSRMD